ncbi:MAG: hypothetical protein KA714_01395 [Limnoraphis sp. WC205]|jgi:hypothetical protein|nr:hypothetical protein [Limnoraphis sp. WC205]
MPTRTFLEEQIAAAEAAITAMAETSKLSILKLVSILGLLTQSLGFNH